MSKYSLQNQQIQRAGLVLGQAIMLLAVTFLFVEGCSNAPEQYKTGKPPTTAPKVDGLQSDLDIDLISSQYIQGFGNEIPIEQGMIAQATQKVSGEESGSEGDRDRDEVAIAQANSKKPIIFGVGLAGITFKTEFNEARKILSKPKDSQSGPNLDFYYYGEGVQIAWRKMSPKTPEQFLALGDYQGPVVIGGKFGEKKMGDSFQKYLKNDSQESWEALMIEVYNTLEKKKDDFNCKSENLCALSGNDGFIVFNYPKGALQFSKDYKTLFLVVLVKQIEIGKLDNDFDLISGQMIAGQERIGLGDTWKTFQEKVGINANSVIGAQLISKRYNGVEVAFEKPGYERNVTEPVDESALKVIRVGVPYEKMIRVNGKFVEVQRNGDDYIFSKREKIESGKKYLSTGLSIGMAEAEAGKSSKIINQLRENFMKSLVSFVEEAIKAEYPTAATITYVNGQYTLKSRKDFIGKIRVKFPETGEGQTIAMVETGLSGDLVTTSVQKFDSPLDQNLSSYFLTEWSPSQSGEVGTMSGFKLGSEATLVDIDNGRHEATLVMNLENSTGVQKIKTRIKYARSALSYTPYLAKKLVPKKVHLAEYEKFGVILSLEPKDLNEENPHVFKVTGIQTGHMKGVQGLCGLSDLKLRMGQFVQDVKSQIDQAIRDATLNDSSYECRYIVSETNDGLHQISSIFFPDDHTAIGFANQELNTVRVYQ